MPVVAEPARCRDDPHVFRIAGEREPNGVGPGLRAARPSIAKDVMLKSLSSISFPRPLYVWIHH